MAEYKTRKLYHIGGYGGSEEPESYESMWAYSIQYPKNDYSTPGRYRIRITRMAAAEFIKMMGGDPGDADDDSFSVQGFLEKWGSAGWIHCLDWIGNPDASNAEIETDLNDMFQAFTTGQPTKANYDTSPVPPRPVPPKKNANKHPNFSVIDGGNTTGTSKSADDSDDPDFEFI